MKYRSSFPYFSEDSIRVVLADIEASLRNGIMTNGPRVQEFEEKFREYAKVKHAVAVSSGASSLEIPLRYFGVKDREVIVPTDTFVATPNSVVFAGGRPVFADIREDTLCLDPEDVKRRISSKTAGIIVVHIAGLICPQINELRDLCADRGLFLIEDCAHAHGAAIDNKMAGTLGDVGCFSMAPTKVMTTGEGGIMITNNDEMAKIARFMRNRGLNSERLMTLLGHSWTMSEITAILGIHQLENLDYFVRRRNEIAKQYESLITKISGLSLLQTPSNILHSYHKFPVRLADEFDLEKIAAELMEKYSVETGTVYYPPCHMHPFYRANFGTKEGDFPISESVLKKTLCLPIHLLMTKEDVQYITESLVACLDNPKNKQFL
ncbi:MAG: DegT/DnrJ/EryC1/StrS family aminotransferase [Candidatus Bathyarchaeia archaeon]